MNRNFTRRYNFSIIRCTPLIITVACILLSVSLPVTAVSAVPNASPTVITTLKDLHKDTVLINDNTANTYIVIPSDGDYRQAAEYIRDAIKKKSGVSVSIIDDYDSRASVPIHSNLVLLGNRSTNRTIDELYNRWFTMLDLRYPGTGGRVVRTLHNPFGNGSNIIFIGGSDDNGVQRASESFATLISETPFTNGTLTVGYITEIELGTDITVPKDVRELLIWDASDGYNSIGYFGWNSLSKRMAAYYMTGDEFHASEFLRLAFPDEQAKQEIAEIDGERIENKNEPLSGPYHYNAHLMIILWDLIEESPFFSDTDRLRITNALARQLIHRADEGVWGLTTPPKHIGTRHGQWSAVSLYCLGRYFQRDYPDAIWEHAYTAANLYFQPLLEHTWVGGENDNLFWYNTGIAPIFTYLLLSGEREAVENGNIGILIRGFEILLSGEMNDPNLRYSSIGFLHKAAYLLNDGRYIHYRERTQRNMTVFRLGQSFWPDESLQPTPPDDLTDTWSIHRLSLPAWRDRESGISFDKSYYYGSYRSAPDGSGDYLLIDGFNGDSRNPYHTMDILRLRINGVTVLSGYRNQLLTSADGLVEPKIPKDAALEKSSVLGSTVFATANVPDAAYAKWQRTIIHRVGDYSLVADDLTFRESGSAMQAEIQWDPAEPDGVTIDAPGSLRLAYPGDTPASEHQTVVHVTLSDPVPTDFDGDYSTMTWRGKASAGETKHLFTLLRKDIRNPLRYAACARIDENAAALALPEAALVVSGNYDVTYAETVILAHDHLAGTALTEAGLDSPLFSASEPVDCDWNFIDGTMVIDAFRNTDIALTTGDRTSPIIDGGTVPVTRNNNKSRFTLSAGRHTITDAFPDETILALIQNRLDTLLEEGRTSRSGQSSNGNDVTIEVPSMAKPFSTTAGGEVTAFEIASRGEKTTLFASAGSAITAINPETRESNMFQTGGAIRVLRWWKEPGLIVAGCTNEKILAFDTSGRKKWEFTSEMDPAVYVAAKTYWFKSTPGHEGIHGLHSGSFLDNENQLIVGSACTIEILDANGKLVRRMPQFWGPPSVFTFIDKPDGSRDLLAARHINGTHNVGIINSHRLDPTLRGFDSVPPGHTRVGGWMSLNRHHLFHEDINGDGTKEVISEINGTWNRVTVWNENGTALYDASFGPGERIPALNIRDIDIGDIDENGEKEILVATWKKMLVALDCRCQRLWSCPLPSTPTVVAFIPPSTTTEPRVMVGCDDGMVYLIDDNGHPVESGEVRGIPTIIKAYNSSEYGNGAFIGTDTGEIALFIAGDIQTGINNQDTPCPFNLGQNCPNPFNASTTIPFTIPTESKVRMYIYDILGKRIATLINDTKQPGSHQIVWDASHMASGIYFCRLEVGAHRAIQKIMLLK